MPSAFSLPCQATVHLAPASMTPGIAVIFTSFGGGGIRKVLWAFPCWIGERNRAAMGRSRRNRRIGGIFMLYRFAVLFLCCKRAGGGHRTDAAFRSGALAELLS